MPKKPITIYETYGEALRLVPVGLVAIALWAVIISVASAVFAGPF